MLIHRFHLPAFGHFTDVAIDLSPPRPDRPGLHLIYGPNEAGKSTARRALRIALYGFEQRAKFDYLHDRAALRVGLTIEDAHGERLSFLRRRGNKNTFLADDGGTPDPEGDARLQRLLAGIGGPEAYESTFAISEQELRAGGQEVIAGKGQLAELIFMAAAGLPRLRKVEAQLNDLAKSLFLPSGKNPAINEGLAELRRLREQQKQLSLAAAEYTGQVQTLENALHEQRDLQAALVTLKREQSRLQGYRQALPPAARRRQRQEKLASLMTVPLLPENFADRCRAAEAIRSVAGTKQQQNSGELQRIKSALRQIELPTELLEAAPDIRSLNERLGSVKQAAEDRRLRLFEIEQTRKEAVSLLRKILPDASLDEVESLRLTRQEHSGITDLRERIGTVRTALHADTESRDKLQRTRTSLSERLKQSEAVASSPKLRESYRRAGRAGDLDAKMQTLSTRIETVERKLVDGLAALTLWEGPADQLPALPIPTAATIDRFEAEFRGLHSQHTKLDEQRQSLMTQRKKVDREFADLTSDGDLPSEESLKNARDIRDGLWQSIRERMAGGSSPDESADAYESAVQRADHLADRLRSEATRVERHATLVIKSEQLKASLAEIAEQLVATETTQAELAERWQAEWPFLRVPALSPPEMRQWTARRDTLAREVEGLRELRRDCEGTKILLDTHVSELRHALNDSADPAPASVVQNAIEPNLSLADWVDRAAQRLAENDAAAGSLVEIREQLTRIDSELQPLQSRIDDAERELEQLKHRWIESMNRLHLPADTSPRQAGVFLDTLSEVFEHLGKIGALNDRVRAMQSHEEKFDSDARDLADRLHASAENRPGREIVPELAARLVEAESLRDRKADLIRQFDFRRRQAETLETELAAAQAEIAALCREAGCSDPAELPAIEQRSRQRRSFEKDIVEADDELQYLAGDRRLGEFLGELEGVEADLLQSTIAENRQREADLQSREKELAEAIGRARAELSRMTGGAAAAQAAEDAEATLARVVTDVEQYVRLKIALRFLRDGRERYREQNGSAVLEHASRLFRELTCGVYQGLNVDYAENDERVLFGVRAESRAQVPTDGMSDGTSDQLYLALRLAGLHSWLDRHEPLPFVVDDLLLHFDDERAAAALRVLNDLATRTQVIFFTHHRHLLGLAEAALPAGTYRVHDLTQTDISAQQSGEPNPPRRTGRKPRTVEAHGHTRNSLFEE